MRLPGLQDNDNVVDSPGGLLIMRTIGTEVYCRPLTVHELRQAIKAMKPKDHEIAKAVNDLRDVAIKYHSTQQLRERIAHVVQELLP